MESLVPQSGERRKRGRPSGKNRTPFTKEERKAINAEYERQRRNQAAEAMLELADAVGLPNVPNTDILASVISYLQSRRDDNGEIEKMRRINRNLIDQIKSCQERLGLPPDSDCDDSEEEEPTPVRTLDNHVHGKRMKLSEVRQVVSEPQTIIPDSSQLEMPNSYITNQPIPYDYQFNCYTPNSLSTELYSSDHNILYSGDSSSSVSPPLADLTSYYSEGHLTQMTPSVHVDAQIHQWDPMYSILDDVVEMEQTYAVQPNFFSS